MIQIIQLSLPRSFSQESQRLLPSLHSDDIAAFFCTKL
jgi:hypothetical protein